MCTAYVCAHTLVNGITAASTFTADVSDGVECVGVYPGDDNNVKFDVIDDEIGVKDDTNDGTCEDDGIDGVLGESDDYGKAAYVDKEEHDDSID